MSDSPSADRCHGCAESTVDALARTVQLRVDRATIDSQRLCPDCFADWIDRYQREMQQDPAELGDPDSDIIVD